MSHKDTKNTSIKNENTSYLKVHRTYSLKGIGAMIFYFFVSSTSSFPTYIPFFPVCETGTVMPSLFK